MHISDQGWPRASGYGHLNESDISGPEGEETSEDLSEGEGEFDFEASDWTSETTYTDDSARFAAQSAGLRRRQRAPRERSQGGEVAQMQREGPQAALRPGGVQGDLSEVNGRFDERGLEAAKATAQKTNTIAMIKLAAAVVLAIAIGVGAIALVGSGYGIPLALIAIPAVLGILGICGGLFYSGLSDMDETEKINENIGFYAAAELYKEEEFGRFCESVLNYAPGTQPVINLDHPERDHQVKNQQAINELKELRRLYNTDSAANHTEIQSRWKALKERNPSLEDILKPKPREQGGGGGIPPHLLGHGAGFE